MVEVRVGRGIETVTTRQIYISESPIGDSVRRNFIDHGKYINSIQGIVTKEAVPVALNTAPFVAGSLPEGKKLYVNAVFASQTQPGILFWVNTQGGAVITPTKEVRFAINLNPLVVKDDKISLSGVIDRSIHWDYDKFKLTYYLTDAGDIGNPITTLHTQAVPIAPNGSFQVPDFGIATLDSKDSIISIIEKPKNGAGNLAITGLYHFPASIHEEIEDLSVSKRGEFEITEVLNKYLNAGNIIHEKLSRGVYWLDAGTTENLLNASQFVHSVQSRQGYLIGSPDEAAWRMKRINESEFKSLVTGMPDSSYKESLQKLFL
jgi:hypothetical protein